MSSLSRKEQLASLPNGEPAFTVKELLGIPLLKQARLLAGNRNVNRVVTRVNVMEVPDVVSWVRPGEFLVTTGYPFKDEPDRLRQLVPELAQKGVAALGIKTKRFFEEMPPEVIEEAEKLDFPLLELPPDTVFSDVVRAVMERVLAQESSLLTELQNRIQAMTRLLLEGGGLYAFLDALEEMLDNPVAIVGEADKPQLSAALRNADPAEAWPIVQALGFKQVGRGAGSGFHMLQNNNRAYVCPIPGGRLKQACLVLLQRGRDISPLDALSVDRLSSLAGLELANLEAVREVEGKYLDQFLQDWLSGKIVSEADWKLRAEVCGCSVSEGATLCAVLVDMGPAAGAGAEKLRELARRLRSDKLRSVDGLLAAPVGGDLALIVPLGGKAGLSAGEAEGAAGPLLNRLLMELRAIVGDRALRLYAGGFAGRSGQVPASWEQANRTRQVVRVCGLPGDTVSYDRLGVYSLLYLIPDGEEKSRFLDRFVVPLRLADRKGGGRLVETLDMFFRCNGNIKLTSEQLYAHYNTVVYRLEKIQTILGVSLDQSEDRLQLQLALKLGEITLGD